MKKLVGLLFVVLCGVLGCGSGSLLVPSVQAAPSSTLSLNCPPAQLAVEKPGLLKVSWGPCNYTASGSSPVSAEASSDVVLTQPLHAVVEKGWIGTNAGSKEEVGVEVTITLPDGRTRLLSDEFDKDSTSIKGDQWQTFNLVLNLPVGTVLHFHSTSGVTNPSTDCPLGCAQDVVWILEDDLS